jgi:adenylate cyclase
MQKNFAISLLSPCFGQTNSLYALFSRLMQFLKFPLSLKFSFRPKVRLRTTLVALSVIQVVGSIAIVGYLANRNREKGIQDFSGQLRAEVSVRVEEEVHHYLEKPYLVNEINTQLAQQKLLQLDNPTELETYFLKQSKIFNQLETIAYSDLARNDYIGANGTGKYTIVASPGNGMQRYGYGAGPNQRGPLLAEKADYDVRQRPWYRTAMKAKSPSWDAITPAPVGQRLDLSAVSPFYESGVMRGVFVTQISLSGISQFLRQLEISKSGQVLILERNGLLVANSTTESPFIPGLQGSLPKRLPAIASKNPHIQAAVKTLNDRFDGLDNIQEKQKLDFMLNNERQLLQVQPFKDGRGIDWLIVVIVPESNFTTEITANTQMTLLWCSLAVMVAIAFGIWSAHRIVRPLLRITRASQEMADGNLQQNDYHSGIVELSSLGNSFNRMAQQIRESFETLEHRVEKRTYELNREKDRSDRLLLNILPESIAHQLKQNNTAPAQQFEEATILFADIVGFTSLSARMEAMELVAGLNKIFSAFDALTEKYGLEKIKTIGDAYMVAGGIPIVRKDHAQAIASMALDMQKEMLRLNEVLGEPLEIRIGIHSGPVVAGVIGIRKFIYDLWGDAVNVASRMESHGEPGCIQVTDVTYELLKDEFVLESRGTIEVKGRGQMQTYWLLDRRSVAACSPRIGG